ncbi:MAG: hypothetical protein NXI10_04975 [bacterium]|nr:hypothetical protein [bacterium]
MKNNIKVNHSDKGVSVEIETRTKSNFGTISALIFSIISFSLPILFLIIGVIYFSDLIGVGFIITLTIFWGTAFYMGKLYLWNKFGVEHYLIRGNDIITYQTYGVFKSKEMVSKFTELEFEAHLVYPEINTNEYEILEEDLVYLVTLADGAIVYKSTIPISYYDYLKCLNSKPIRILQSTH